MYVIGTGVVCDKNGWRWQSVCCDKYWDN